MKYTVRSPEGEVVFDSFEALRQAVGSGMVEPNDEVRREDEADWRPAGTLPGLTSQTPARKRDPQTLLLAAAITLGVLALALLVKGGQDPQFYVYGVVAAFVVAGILFTVTRNTARRR